MPEKNQVFEEFYFDGNETESIKKQVCKMFIENTSLKAPWILKRIGNLSKKPFLVINYLSNFIKDKPENFVKSIFPPSSGWIYDRSVVANYRLLYIVESNNKQRQSYNNLEWSVDRCTGIY